MDAPPPSISNVEHNSDFGPYKARESVQNPNTTVDTDERLEEDGANGLRDDSPCQSRVTAPARQQASVDFSHQSSLNPQQSISNDEIQAFLNTSSRNVRPHNGSGEDLVDISRDVTGPAVSPLLNDDRLTRNSEEDEHEKVARQDVVEHIPNAEVPIESWDYDPIDTPDAEALGYPKLDFKPFSIQNWFLFTTLGFFLVCVGGIAAMIFLGKQNGNTFHISNSQRHMAFRYVPAAVGTLTTLWWRTVITALGRMTPYISMAAKAKPSLRDGDISRKVHRTLENAYANNIFTLNIITIAQNGHWLLFISIIVQRLMMLFIVPLKASFLQIVPDSNGWTVIVLPKVGYALISIYGVLFLVTLVMLIRLWDRSTGVKCDPVSIADQLALVQGSNILGLFQGLEFANRLQMNNVLKERSPQFGSLRLGYWRHRQNGTIWHGLGCILDSAGRPAAKKPQSSPRRILCEDAQHHPNEENLTEMPLDFEQRQVRNPETYRYRIVSSFLYDSTLAIYTSTLIVVLALTITGLVDHRVQEGFYSTFSTFTTSIQEFATITDPFIYRFLPVLLMSAFNLLWVNADSFYRNFQPFAGMKDGGSATSTILLDYPSSPPVLVQIKAATNGHWQVVIFSLLSLGSSAPPIVATGVFVSTATSFGYTVSIEPVNFWAIFVILCIYIFCLIIARPTPGYRLPRYVNSISDVLSYCYASRILDDLSADGKPIFSAQDTNEERIHLESRIHLAKQEYEFGLYLGKDGKRHLGFDVAVREDATRRQVHVTKIDPGTGVYLGFGTLWLRRPKVVTEQV